MKIRFILIILLCCSCSNNHFSGYVYDYDTELPIKNVTIHCNDNNVQTDSSGFFSLNVKSNVASVIVLQKEDYAVKKIYRKPDSLGKFSQSSLKKNKIYLFNKQSDFSKKY